MNSAIHILALLNITSMLIGCNGSGERISNDSASFATTRNSIRFVPQIDTENVLVFCKPLEHRKNLLVERAYLYGLSAGFEGKFQYAFVIAGPNAGDRDIRWIRIATEERHMSGAIVDPTIEVLDACLVGSDLIIVFNQYDLCFAYRISSDKELAMSGRAQPAADISSTIGSVENGSLGPRAALAKVDPRTGNVAVRKPEQSELITHRLTQSADSHAYRWQAEEQLGE